MRKLSVRLPFKIFKIRNFLRNEWPQKNKSISTFKNSRNINITATGIIATRGKQQNRHTVRYEKGNMTTKMENEKMKVHDDAASFKKRKRLSKKERKAFKKKSKKNFADHEKKNESEDKEKQQQDKHQKSNKKSISNAKEVMNTKGNTKEEAEPQSKTADSADESWMMGSYKSIPVPEKPCQDIVNTCNSKHSQKVKHDDVEEGGGGPSSSSGQSKSLGKWFPNALLIKCPVNYSNTGKLLLLNESKLTESDVKVEQPKASLVLFYQYTPTKWTPTQLQLLMTYLQTVATTRQHIGGRIRISQEGVNCTVSAVDSPRYKGKEVLRHFAQDLRNFDLATFNKTDFKYIDNLPPDRHFKELKIIPVQELVFYGIDSKTAPLDNETKAADGIRGGIHLEAKEYHEMLKKDNTVVIDVRNHYETIIGRFDGQEKQQQDPIEASNKKKKLKKEQEETDAATDNDEKAVSGANGAKYLDPLMRKSTDFKSWLAKDDTKAKLQNKTVLMYCTGGIRCERASAYLKKEMGNEVSGVYQLQGGIERYLQAFPDGGFWRGKNFVFDKREAVSVDNPEGDGGVIRKQKKKNKSKTKNADDDELPSKCVVCDVPWDRYVGKKKCCTCGVPVLMCDKCMSLKPDKTPGTQLKVRCPLCVSENITQPACEVDWTANGIKSAAAAASSGKNDETNSSNNKKAAGSVLKWGGGHASNKKLGRKVKGRMCRFGAECVRKDCFFEHPSKRQNI